MDRYLLDTHTAIWFFNGDNALSETAKKIILDTSNIKYLSIASAWEIAIKLSIGKLDIDGNTADFIHDVESNGFIFLPIKPSHLSVYESLPLLHRDPFDRLLVATAISEQMTFISADKNVAQYDVPLIW
jgi:PIN domain nuclease of toxin-antitoxin system